MKNLKFISNTATFIIFASLFLCFFVICKPAQAIPVALVHADPGTTGYVKSFLVETGQFGSSEIDYIDATSSTPSLSTLSNYDSLLVWANITFYDPVGLGNVLADYVDAGGGVVLATYALGESWKVGGRMLDPGYSPFSIPPLTLTTSGSLDMSNAMTSHPIMDGVTEASYWVNSNYSDPGLTSGSTLIAQDTDGNNLVAINAAGNVAGIVIYPGYVGWDDPLGASEGTKVLFANALNYTANPPDPIPEPATMMLLGSGLIGLAGFRRKKKN